MKAALWVGLSLMLVTAGQDASQRDYVSELPLIVDTQSSARDATTEADAVVVVDVTARKLFAKPSEFSGQLNVYDDIYSENTATVVEIVKGATISPGDVIRFQLVGGRRTGGVFMAHEQDPMRIGARYLAFLKEVKGAEAELHLYYPAHQLASLYELRGGRLRALLATRIAPEITGKPFNKLLSYLRTLNR